MPRFVVLEHDHPVLHWDLMLEAGPVLRTWRLSEPPAPGKVIAAEALADHRLFYLDYEGPVSGGRGFVKRWLEGTFEMIKESPDILELNCRFLNGTEKMRLMRLIREKWEFVFSDQQ